MESLDDTSLHKLFIDIFKYTFKVAWKRNEKYWPILEEFNKQYHGLIAHKKSMGQTVEEWKFEETFEELKISIGAFAKMNKVLLVFRKNGWVLSAMEVRNIIKIWSYIYNAGTKVLKIPLVCDIWADEVKSYGNLYAHGTLGQ